MWLIPQWILPQIPMHRPVPLPFSTRYFLTFLIQPGHALPNSLVEIGLKNGSARPVSKCRVVTRGIRQKTLGLSNHIHGLPIVVLGNEPEVTPNAAKSIKQSSNARRHRFHPLQGAAYHGFTPHPRCQTG